MWKKDQNTTFGWQSRRKLIFELEKEKLVRVQEFFFLNGKIHMLASRPPPPLALLPPPKKNAAKNLKYAKFFKIYSEFPNHILLKFQIICNLILNFKL